MSFNSLKFLIFLPLVFTVSACLNGKSRILWLLATSYVFYASMGSLFLVLALVVVTLLTYWSGLQLVIGSNKSRKWWLRIGVLGNVSILVAMKYLPFLGENVNYLYRLAGFTGSNGVWPAILSVGVSFLYSRRLGICRMSILNCRLRSRTSATSLCHWLFSQS